MTSLVLGLALSTPAHPPQPVGPYGPVPRPAVVYPPRAVPLPQAVPAYPAVPAVPVVRQYTPPPPPVVVPQPVPPPVFVPPPAPPAPVALTLDQFSRTFTPTPGKHHVWLVHPKTSQPVLVCFTLPDAGKLKRFEVGPRWIEFEFSRPDLDVDITFRHNGTVDVEYDD